MRPYLRALQTYLNDIGEAGPKKLGEAAPPLSQGSLASAQASLEISLRKDARKTDRILLIAVGLLCCLFALGFGLTIYHRNSPTNVAALFGGGTFLSLLGIVAWLRKLWFDKRTMDLLLALTQSMTPADAAKALTSFYFGALTAK